eukprot:4807949-Amphidinium_carterae.1
MIAEHSRQGGVQNVSMPSGAVRIVQCVKDQVVHYPMCFHRHSAWLKVFEIRPNCWNRGIFMKFTTQGSRKLRGSLFSSI